jgi:hypothetical protein
MNKFFKDTVSLLQWLFPFICTCAFSYVFGAFIEWSRDPADWTWQARFCTVIFGVSLGFAVDRRLEMAVRD